MRQACEIRLSVSECIGLTNVGGIERHLFENIWKIMEDLECQTKRNKFDFGIRVSEEF